MMLKTFFGTLNTYPSNVWVVGIRSINGRIRKLSGFDELRGYRFSTAGLEKSTVRPNESATYTCKPMEELLFRGYAQTRLL